MKKLIVALSILFSSGLYSQGYQYQSEITKNPTTGFYKVEIEPNILGKLNYNFADLKLVDDKNEAVPYYLEKEDFSITKRVFKEYKVKAKIKWRNGATVLFIENTDKSTINNIQLQIKNFDVRKRLELAGSDNYEDWYTIKENYVFRSANGGNITSEVKSLNFPYCDYKYYRIIIYDVFSLPINVMKVGYFDTYQELGKFKKVATPIATYIDTTGVKETFIHLSFIDKPYCDKLVFDIEKPAYFYRRARLAIKQKNYKGKEYFETLTSFTLNSNSDLTLYLNDFPNQEFYVIINNEDNPPLKIKGIEAYQLNRYLITHLESENKYKLVFGNENKLVQPSYDIEFFKNKVGADVPVLKTGELSNVIYKEAEKAKKPAQYWIWVAVAIVAVLLGFVSYKMIMEMEKR